MDAYVKRTVWVILAAFIVLVLAMWGLPQYNVYRQKKQGQALLAHANYSKEVAVTEARAKMEAAYMLAEVDTIRAHGVAKANQIIGISLKNNEAYLRWLWIDNIEKNPQATIYIPTEANIPIMEAGRVSTAARYLPDTLK